MNPTQCLVDHALSVSTRREKVFVEQTNQFEYSSQWLADAIQSCKRKIVEGAGQEFVEPKRVKSAVHKDEPGHAALANVNSDVAQGDSKQPKLEDHPEYERVKGLKVLQLRDELRSLGMDATGRKNQLQKRLLEHLVAANESGQSMDALVSIGENKCMEIIEGRSSNEEKPVVQEVEAVPKSSNKKSDNDVEMLDDPVSQKKLSEGSPHVRKDIPMDIDEPVPKPGQATIIEPSVAKSSTSNTIGDSEEVAKLKSESGQNKPAVVRKAPVASSSSPFRAMLANSLVRSASKLFSPSTKGGTKATAVPNGGEKKEATRVDPTTTVQDNQQSHINPALSQDSTKPGSLSSEREGVATPAVASISTSAIGVPSVSTSATAKHKQLADARKARLAEIRGKSKPVALSGSGGTAGNNPNRLLNPSSAKESTEDKRKVLAAQMREKAAASGKIKVDKSSTATTANPILLKSKIVPTKPVGMSSKSKPTPAGVLSVAQKPRIDREHASSTQKTKAVASAAPSPKRVASSKTGGILVPKKTVYPNSAKMAKSPAPMRNIAPKPVRSDLRDVKTEHRNRVLSPMDTYEISDRDDSDDSDSEDSYSNRKPRKKIPEWAQKHNLILALERQFDDELKKKLNPDLIFPEVESCNLEAIFDRKKARYKSRTSSGNWTKDRVTVHEKLVYSRSMGYAMQS